MVQAPPATKKPLTLPPRKRQSEGRRANGTFAKGNPTQFRKGDVGNPKGNGPLSKPKADALPTQLPRTKQELNDWIEGATGYRLPLKAVCPGHTAPLDVVWQVFNHEVNEAVVLASRGSGKTLALALLHVANSILKEAFETAHFGAIQPQALRCHKYVDEAARKPSVKQTIDDLLKTRVSFKNGSELTISPLTDRQTQSPHAALVSVDEVESAKAEPLKRVRSVPMQYGEQAGQLILASTRVDAAGLMNATLEDAKAKGVPVFEWCFWETLKPCTIKPDSPLYDSLPAALRLDSEGGSVKVTSDGWRSLKDLLAAHSRVDEETWQCEYMNKKLSAKALVYPVDPVVTEDAEYKPHAGPLFIGGDWGFSDDTAFVFGQLRGQQLAVFDMLSGKGQSERVWVRRIVEFVTELEDYEGPDMEEWERIWEQGDWRAATWPKCWPQVAHDPSAAQLRAELKAHGITPYSAKRTKHNVVTGQGVLRGAMQTSIIIHPRVKELLVARQNYRTKQLPDGSYSQTPDADERNHRFSHPLDALRYLTWCIRRQLGLGSAPDDADVEEKE